VYKIKPSFDGKLDKLKTQLVAKGYEQIPRIDFNKTFMLVIQWNMVRLIVVFVAHKKWELSDVNTSFLNNILKEDVFMVQLESFHI
jgi:hypothetical protein